jgi:hypothetical protein
MGERLRSTEEALEEDKRRQEANLLKLMKARQRKNLKQTVKKIDKETEELHQEIDKLKVKVDKHKADVYAEQGIKNQAGLVEEDVAKKAAKVIAEVTQNNEGAQINFNGELTAQEKDDLEIERAQLEMNKQKELKAIDVQVEEELDSQVKRRKQEREDEKMRLQRLISGE